MEKAFPPCGKAHLSTRESPYGKAGKAFRLCNNYYRKRQTKATWHRKTGVTGKYGGVIRRKTQNIKHAEERKADKIESPRASTASILRKKNVNIFYLRYCINIQSGRAQQQHADDSAR